MANSPGLLCKVWFNREELLVKKLPTLFDNIRCKAQAGQAIAESSSSQRIRRRDVKRNDTASPELVPMSDFNAVAASGRVTLLVLPFIFASFLGPHT